MAGQRLEIEHLLAKFGDGLQDARLAAAGGAADDTKRQGGRQLLQLRDDMAAPGLVAPVELDGLPADGAEDGVIEPLRLPPRQQ